MESSSRGGTFWPSSTLKVAFELHENTQIPGLAGTTRVLLSEDVSTRRGADSDGNDPRPETLLKQNLLLLQEAGTRAAFREEP